MDFWLQLHIERRENNNNLQSDHSVLSARMDKSLQYYFEKNKKWVVNELKFSEHQDGFVMQNEGETFFVHSGDVVEYGDFVITLSLSKQIKKSFHDRDTVNPIIETASFSAHDFSIENAMPLAIDQSLSFLNTIYTERQPNDARMNPFHLTADLAWKGDELSSDPVRNEQSPIPIIKNRSFIQYIKRAFFK